MNNPIIDQINIIIETCKSNIELNLIKTKMNLSLISEIKKEQPSKTTSEKLKSLYFENDYLHDFNKNAILLQSNLFALVKSINQIIDSLPSDKIKELLEKFNGTIAYESEDSSNMELNENKTGSGEVSDFEFNLIEEEIFSKTIEKKMEFDSNHPFFNNFGFKNKLVKYFEAIEDYEMCTKITNKKKAQN